MSFGGGSSTQTTEMPQWLQDAAQQNLARADYTSRLGYVPDYGMDVAAFSPMQMQGFQNTGSMAQAFGLAPAGYDATAGIPTPETNNLGFSGYRSGNLFDESLSQLQQRRPAQYQAMQDMFINPQTGENNVMFTPYGSVASEQAGAGTQGAVDYSSSDSGVTGAKGDYYDFISSAPVEWLSKNFGDPSMAQAITSPLFSILGSMARDAVTDYYNPVADAGYNPVIPVSAGGSYDSYSQFNPSTNSGSSDMSGWTGGNTSTTTGGGGYTTGGWSSSSPSVSDQGGNLGGGYITGGW